MFARSKDRLPEIIRMPPDLIVRKLVYRIVRAIRRVRAELFGTTISDAAYRRALVSSAAAENFFEAAQSDQGIKFFLDPGRKEDWINRFREDFPSVIGTTIEAADKSCEHEFDLMGSGPVRLGDPINWHLDFRSGFTFKKRDYYTEIHHAPYPGGYDILFPWELSRFQHAAWLGQAYWFSGEERYAAEFVSQVRDWIAENPPEYGVNWSCTMDVAIRAVNWLWGYFFFLDSDALDQDFSREFSKSLLSHGRFIFKNLENRGKNPGNHYLANLAGLLYLGLLCPNFKEASKWRKFSLKELEQQLFAQVHPDGANFEDSTNYHRLAAEMFLSIMILSRRNGYTFSPEFLERIEKMIEVILHITRPDGTVPQVGDCDNSRLQRLKIWDPPGKEWHDYRYLFAVGAVLFDRRDFGLAAGDQWEEAYWLLGQEAWEVRESLGGETGFPVLPSIIFPDVGWTVLRGRSSHVVVTAGPVGQKGKGGHSHNDELGFELFANGQAWFVDTGTGCYTADYDLRNRMRSTASHNTIRVGKEEQHPFDPQAVFRLKSQKQKPVLDLSAGDDSVSLIAEIGVYKRLGITHTRRFRLQNNPFEFFVDDRMASADMRLFEAFLHPHPDLEVILDEDTILIQNSLGTTLLVETALSGAAEPGEWVLGESKFSPSYGVVQQSRVLKLCWRAQGETRLTMRMLMAGNNP